MATASVPPCKNCGAERVRSASGRIDCRPCAAASTRRYYAANREAVKAKNRERYARNPAYFKDHCRAWREANPEASKRAAATWKAANRDRMLAKQREWSQANLDRAREYSNRRRAQKLAAVCEHGPACVTADVYVWVRSQPCRYCGAPAEDADHYIPLSRGGLHCRENIVPACAWCNGSKHNRLPDEWRAALREAAS